MSSKPAITTVLFVLTNSALNRGMNTGLENLAWGLAERGLEVHILCGGSAPDSHGYKLPENVNYHFTGVPGENPASFLPRFRQIAGQYRIDAVVGWIINTALLVGEDCAKGMAFFGNVGQMPPRSIVLRFVKAALFAKMRLSEAARLIATIRAYPGAVKTIVSISQTVQDASISAYRLAPERCMVILRGIDTELYAYKERSNKIGTPIEILFAGNIHDNKGVGNLVDAMAFIKTPLRLRLCGRAQPEYVDSLKAKAENYGHQLAYMGPQNQADLVSYYQQCDIFAFPSHSEGLGKALIEAMSCGCAVVCSDIPTLKEIVQNGHNGLMVSVRSPEAIAGAIQRYIKEPSLRKQCSQNARRTVEERFDRQHEIDGWLGLLRGLKA